MPLSTSLARRLILAALVSAGSFTVAVAEEHPQLQVPAGYEATVVAKQPLVNRPVMACFDESGRLFVVDSNGDNLPFDELIKAPPHRIVVLEDTDGDGVFDTSKVFADKLVMPQGVQPYRGHVYVASPPHVWDLADTDGDGVADARSELVGQFGSTGNAADVHGPILGPDGWLYICDGRNGHNLTMSSGKTDSGRAAGIYRVRPDGTGLQRVVGGGMDNPVEVDFTPGGELLGAVNLLHAYPRQDCLTYWIDGGVYPREEMQDVLDELPYMGGLLPASHLYGHVAVSGMMRCRSAELGSGFQNSFFVTFFNRHKLVRTVMERAGATFIGKTEEFASCNERDFHPTDVLEDADGSLLLLNTGGWFRIACPESQVARPEVLGAIYRIRKTGSHTVKDPRGRSLAWTNAGEADLLKRLADPRFAVRDRAIDELTYRDPVRVRELVLSQGNPIVSEMLAGRWSPPHAALLQLCGRIMATPALQSVAGSDRAHPEARIAALNALSTGPVGPSGKTNHEAPDLTDFAVPVASNDPAVARSAAIAIGRITGLNSSFKPTSPDVETKLAAVMLKRLDSTAGDQFLIHALTWGLSQLQSDAAANFISEALAGDSLQATAQRGALIVLSQGDGSRVHRPVIARLLQMDDEPLRNEVLRVIARHGDWSDLIPELLAASLKSPDPSEQSLTLVESLAATRAGDAGVQQVLAECLSNTAAAPAARRVAWSVIRTASVKELPASWLNAIDNAVKSGSVSDQREAAACIGSRRMERFVTVLQTMIADTERPLDVRFDAAAALASLRLGLDDVPFDLLREALNDNHDAMRAVGAARGLAESQLNGLQLRRLVDQVPQVSPLALPVLLPAFRGSKNAALGTTLITHLINSPAADNLSAESVAAVLAEFPPDVRSAADPLLKRLGGESIAEQQARFKELSELVSGGNPSDGRIVFLSQAAACSGCHRVGDTGGKVGPDLSHIGGARTGGDLLEAIVYPSATFVRDFRPQVVLTSSGTTVTGVLARQTRDSITLRTAELKEVTIKRSEIDEMRESPVSIMPKGVDKTLSPQQLRDLLAYLQSLK